MIEDVVTYGSGDLARLEPLWNSLREHYETLENTPGDIYERAESWRRRHQTYLEILEHGGAIVAIELGGEPIAYAAVQAVSSSPVFTWSERAMTIETFVVSDRHRGRGLGRRLLAAVRTLAGERGEDELQLMVLPSNRSAIEFYRAEGFGVYCLLLSDALPGREADLTR